MKHLIVPLSKQIAQALRISYLGLGAVSTLKGLSACLVFLYYRHQHVFRSAGVCVEEDVGRGIEAYHSNRNENLRNQQVIKAQFS